MKHGFIKAAAATPEIRVADCDFNTEQILTLIKKACEEEVKVLAFPELCITGYTCGDLFLQDILINKAEQSLKQIAAETKEKDLIVAVGLPFLKEGKLFNVAAIIQNGIVLGFVPKINIPSYSEFYEARYFQAGNLEAEWIEFDGYKVPFGSKILFACKEIKELILGIEVCEDLWVVQPPSNFHAVAGASVILNLSASDEATGKDCYRLQLVTSQSARLVSAYIYADAGEGESTTDLVFSGHNIIAENGTLLKEAKRFTTGMITTEIDLSRLYSERKRLTTYVMNHSNYTILSYSMPSLLKEIELPEIKLTRFIDCAPFVPSDKTEQEKRCEEIIMLQALGLKKRLKHIGCKKAVIGISGGLDSTLALLITSKAFDMLGLDKKGMIAVTMPCFGTTDRTYQNAVRLIQETNAFFEEVNISQAVKGHLKDIGHEESIHDVTYENAQARERTQVLMDIANKYNAIVVGTGDMSELALGWATYNGDHMSMYGVNASVPKTLVRYLVAYFAETTKNTVLKNVLRDILDTPVSPELLPPVDGVISQKTEDLVGPYELHDFYLYYMMRFGYTPTKIYRMAVCAFEGQYEKKTILKWLNVFYRRFFSQQFKRSCLPDGPKVGSVALSPRGDLRMPSDACAAIWLKELETL